LYSAFAVCSVNSPDHFETTKRYLTAQGWSQAHHHRLSHAQALGHAEILAHALSVLTLTPN
jgi:hemerythrin